MSGVPAPSLNNEIPLNTVPRVLLVGMRPVMACWRSRGTVTVGCEKLCGFLLVPKVCRTNEREESTFSGYPTSRWAPRMLEVAPMSFEEIIIFF